MQSDARECERVTRRHARTFALASAFLPARKRRAAFAIYAFCRHADDIVDAATARGTASTGFAEFRARLAAALAGEPPDAYFRELVHAAHSFAITGPDLQALLDGVARDLVPEQYTSWAELARYCHGVASTVGVLCTRVFGVTHHADHAEALRCAETLGVAMQLTNILRDVGEDARRGRCYLPNDELDAFGLSCHAIIGGHIGARDPRWRSLMRFEISRARDLYAAALPGIPMLERDSQRCAMACATGYARILDAIEQIGYDSLNRRAHITSAAKAAVIFSTLLRAPTPA